MANHPRLFAAQLTVGEEVRHTFRCGWVPGAGPAYLPAVAAITDRRLLVAARFALFNRPRAAVDLGQITELRVDGAALAVVTADRRLTLTGLGSVNARLLRDAIAAVRR